MFYPGTSLHPSMWSRGDMGDKEAWSLYFESSYRGNGKKRDWGKEKARGVEGIAFWRRSRDWYWTVHVSCVNVTNLWCGNNSRWWLGPVQWNYVWLWWAVVKHTHIYLNTLFSCTGSIFATVSNRDQTSKLYCFDFAISTFLVLSRACSNTRYYSMWDWKRCTTCWGFLIHFSA